MSDHVWEQKFCVDRTGSREENKYTVYRCVNCKQELWHYHAISWSVSQAERLEQVPLRCRRGCTVIATHNQVALFFLDQQKTQRKRRRLQLQ